MEMLLFSRVLVITAAAAELFVVDILLLLLLLLYVGLLVLFCYICPFFRFGNTLNITALYG